MKQKCIFQNKIRTAFYAMVMLSGALLLLLSCATKHKIKQTANIEQKTEHVLTNDSVVQSAINVKNVEVQQFESEFESILKALNIAYDGDQENDLKVVFNRTQNGTELNVSGKGKANYNEQSTQQIKSLTRIEIAQVFDSIVEARFNQYKNERSQSVLDSFQSETDKKKTDTSFWVYVVIGCCLAIGIVVYLVLNNLS